MRPRPALPPALPLLDGETYGVPDGTTATWADVKASALEFLGIILTDADVGRVPMLLTDAYGNLIPGGQWLCPDGDGATPFLIRENTPPVPHHCLWEWDDQ